ncbi:uncharacterized protein LOC131950771 [Physella acuta]|uniref:uncharacterized protein LOC131950771 n=1 Tax=Physella acuta TaxID=109671 RepID=UPI0027DDB276|nr:uncharacterized protein LOC131950771 [Physella acuta]
MRVDGRAVCDLLITEDGGCISQVANSCDFECFKEGKDLYEMKYNVTIQDNHNYITSEICLMWLNTLAQNETTCVGIYVQDENTKITYQTMVLQFSYNILTLQQRPMYFIHSIDWLFWSLFSYYNPFTVMTVFTSSGENLYSHNFFLDDNVSQIVQKHSDLDKDIIYTVNDDYCIQFALVCKLVDARLPKCEPPVYTNAESYVELSLRCISPQKFTTDLYKTDVEDLSVKNIKDQLLEENGSFIQDWTWRFSRPAVDLTNVSFLFQIELQLLDSTECNISRSFRDTNSNNASYLFV